MLHRFTTSITDIPLPERFTYPFCYTPHPLCILAAKEVQSYLTRQTAWKDELRQGKMFGVLIVQTEHGETGYLAAFSGILAGKNLHPFFVPPVYDLLQPQGFFKIEEEKISSINCNIRQLENDKAYAALSAELARTIQSAENILATAKAQLKEAKTAREQRRKEKELNAQEEAELIRESQFQKYQDQILAACFMVPCQYLSDYYFKLLPVLRDSIQLRSIHSVTSIIWYKAADGLFYLQLDIPNLSDGTDNEFQQLKKQYPDVRLRKIQLNYFAIDAELTEGTPQGVIKIEPNYTVDHEIIPIKRENRIIILCAQKTSYKPKNKYSVCMDGTTYLLKCCQKISVRMVNSYQMNNQVVEYSIKKGFNKELFRDYYYYFRADEVEPWQLDCSANLSYRLKAKLGLLGRLLDTVPAIDKLAVVLEVVDTRVIVQFRNKATLSRFPQRYTVLKPGDIVFKYESKLYKIENQMLLDNVAMVHGEVVSKNGDNLFIAFPDNEYNKDYYYFDVNQEFKIGDKVRFFPVLNRANRFYGSPLACLVRKDEA